MFCEWICPNEESVDATECITTSSIPDMATPRGPSLLLQVQRSTSDALTFDSPCVFPFIVIEGTDIMSNNCTNYLEDDPSNYWCGTGEGTWGYCNTTRLFDGNPTCPIADKSVLTADLAMLEDAMLEADKLAMRQECMTLSSKPDTATPRITSNALTFDSECIFPFIVIEGTDIMSNNCTNYLEEDPSNYWCGTGEGTWGYCNTTKLSCPIAEKSVLTADLAMLEDDRLAMRQGELCDGVTCLTVKDLQIPCDFTFANVCGDLVDPPTGFGRDIFLRDLCPTICT